ncbi:MAG TPA: Na+/H+ antiporter [Actinospica sp.]|nr:Na+/H+ antiporter [Actinospica sp.]
MRGAGIVVALVVASTAVATFANKWRIPAPSVLVLFGLGAALLPGVPAVHLSPELISVLVLPPLLYASAQDISARELGAIWRPLLALTLGLVLATAFAIGGLAVWVTSLSMPMAFVLGSVLASTDPVAVTALGRRLPLPPRIQGLVQSESLFNDATSLVLFQVAVGVAVGSGGVHWAAAGWRFVVLAGGGMGVGAALAVLVIALRSRAADPVLQTVIALVTPYTAYLLAQGAGVSGVTAVVVAGVVVGSAGHKITDARIRLQVHAVYNVVVFLLESVVFALIGLGLPTLVRDLPAGSRWWPVQAAVLAAALIAVRVAWMRPTVTRAGPTRGHPAWPVTRVMAWAGTRGVMPLAAALTIPLTTASGAPLTQRPLVLVLTTAVVAITLTLQGLTLATVVRTSGLAVDPEHVAAKEEQVRASLDEAALEYLDELREDDAIPGEVLDRLRRRFNTRLGRVGEGAWPAADFVELQRRVLDVQRAELRRLYADGRVSDRMQRQITHELDQAEEGVAR